MTLAAPAATAGPLAAFRETALERRVALVTGGGTGIGADMAAGFASLGARVP